MGGGAKYHAKHERAILALLEAPTIEKAADAAGISHATIARWLQRADFQESYALARRRIFEASLARLQTLTGKATEALRRALVCGRPNVEVRAAVAVLASAGEAALLSEFSDRLRALERKQEETT